jgi:polyisoprenoid-binding protein YceI
MKKSVLCIVITICSLANSYTQELLKINSSKSEIEWSCDYAFYFGGHQGAIGFKEGYFIKNNGVISGGEFIIDMNSIVCTDNGKIDRDSGLVNHLKNEDFFDIMKFPMAKLVITNVSYDNGTRLKIYANLTIKDVTLPINFRGEVNYDKKQMTTKFKIDRTLWGINFNSKEVEGKLKDGLISDAIGFEVKLSL